jgi:phosphoribosyl 1,2-cyclic phosphodiesterase
VVDVHKYIVASECLGEPIMQAIVIECFAYSGELPGHITWDVLKPRLPDLRAQRIMLTHMNPTMLAHLDEVRAAGAIVAEDGAVIDL